MFTAATAAAWIVAVVVDLVSPMWAAAIGGPMIMMIGVAEAASSHDE